MVTIVVVLAVGRFLVAAVVVAVVVGVALGRVLVWLWVRLRVVVGLGDGSWWVSVMGLGGLDAVWVGLWLELVVLGWCWVTVGGGRGVGG